MITVCVLKMWSVGEITALLSGICATLEKALSLSRKGKNPVPVGITVRGKLLTLSIRQSSPMPDTAVLTKL